MNPIRKFQNSDTLYILQFWEKSSMVAHPFLHPNYVNQIKNDLKEIYLPNAETWVYKENSQIIGFISMIQNEIGGLFVLPDFHSSGIGTKLVNYVNKFHEILEVEVFAKNDKGRNFYTKYGFELLHQYVHEESQEEMIRMKFIGSNRNC